MFRRLREAAAILRPKAVAQLGSRLARVSSEHDALSRLVRVQTRASEKQLAALTREIERTRDACAGVQAALTAHVAELTAQVATLRADAHQAALRNDQLMVAAERVATDVDLAPVLGEVLDAATVRAHVQGVLDRTPMEPDPYPHMVLDDLLPPLFYKTLIDTMPPAVLFEDGSVNKQRLKVPPRAAGPATFRMWRFLVAEIIEGYLQDALIARFHRPLTEYARRFWPDADIDALKLNGSDGRIILRRRGYVIPPHRDPKWAWLTFILYLAKPGDPDTWGTQIYRVSDDIEAPGAQPFWMQQHHHELVKDVRFVPNRALVFLNADGSHGASIPDDAPADFERYIYQFRIGPEGQMIERLKAALTPEARKKWEGKDGY